MMRFIELLKYDSQAMTGVPTGISKFEDEFLLAVHIFVLDLGLVTPSYHVALLAHVKLTREVLIYVRWQITAVCVCVCVCDVPEQKLITN